MYFQKFKNNIINFNRTSFLFNNTLALASKSFFIFNIFKHRVYFKILNNFKSRLFFIFGLSNFYLNIYYPYFCLNNFVFFTTNSEQSEEEGQNSESELNSDSDLEDDDSPSDLNPLNTKQLLQNNNNNPNSNKPKPSGNGQQSNKSDTPIEDLNILNALMSSNTKYKQPIISTEVAKTSDFFLQPIDIQQEMETKFNFQSQLLDKTKFVSSNFSFLKSQQNVLFLKNNKDFTFITFNYFLDIYKLFLNSHINIIKNIKPVSFSYIQFLDLVLRKSSHSGLDNTVNTKVATNSILFSNILPSIPYFVGSAIYGQSLGAYDLLPFIPKCFESYKFEMNIKNNNASEVRLEYFKPLDNKLSRKISLDLKDNPIFVYDVMSYSKPELKFYFENSNTIYNRKSFNQLFNELFTISSGLYDKSIFVEAQYMMQTSPTRSSITARNNSGSFETFSNGYSTENVTLSNINFIFSDIQILNIVLFLFHLPEFEHINEKQTNELLRYICSIFTSYIISQIINVLKIDYIFLKISFEIKLNNIQNNNINKLHNIFKQYVDSGLIIPLTPLHFKFYINSNIQEFYKYILSSVLIIPSLNFSVNTVLPYINKESKNNFYAYATNKDMLNINYYSSKTTLNPFPSFAITWEEFIYEMAVRNILFGEFHDAIPIITAGQWKGISACSLELECPYNNSFFVKFNLVDDDQINDYLNTLLWKDNSHPNFIKKSSRIVEKLPKLFNRFVYPEHDSGYVLDLQPQDINGKIIYTYNYNNDNLIMKNKLLKTLYTNSKINFTIKRTYTYSSKLFKNVSKQLRIIDEYINIRCKDSRFTFDNEQVKIIDNAFDMVNTPLYNSKSLFLKPKSLPKDIFDSKQSDSFMIRLWNIIFPFGHITQISEIKEMSESILYDYDNQYPSGQHMSEKELIRYITAHSSSSFLGIQSKHKSKFALQSLINTIHRHASYVFKDKPWLIPNLKFIDNHLSKNRIMDKRYGDVCMYAKTSSTSIKHEKRDFREYVFENTLDDVLNRFNNSEKPPYTITAAQRDSRRGKSRLICSFHADIRILDFYINNGSYDLCNRGGFLSNYTTEGLSGMLLWNELALMSKRDHGKTMICLDFKGYDTQISLKEYMEISQFLNTHRLKNDKFYNIFNIFNDWMYQPKMLLSQGINKQEILIPNYKTLASGLHGTHSFENLIGISYAKELENIGIPVYLFKANGDDQNIMTHSSKIDDLMYFTNEYFDVEYSKSLIGHDLTVWGKKWFTRALYPVIEIGTIRSLWEREGGDVNMIEPSKFENNYCKIINLIIFLIRLDVSQNIIYDIMIELCQQVGIKHNQIPVSLTNFKQIKSGKTKPNSLPVGLESDKFYLESKTLDLNIIGARNIYDMLRQSYENKTYYSNEILNVEYHPINTTFDIEANLDYSTNMESRIPWQFRGIEIPRLNVYQSFVRSVLQGTGSYDGPTTNTYQFHDMFTLAKSIHQRNYSVWFKIQSRIK